MSDNHFYQSNKNFLKVENVIPLGSQTFSKSYLQYPRGISPLFAKNAKGSKLWDIDGNRFIDLVNSLAAVTLGYRNNKVDGAVRRQLRKGVIYSLPDKLEYEVAEKICYLVPSAEMVRFGKNGTDATSAAVRIARAYTGRSHVAICGYHGWQDWSIGITTRNKGVPTEVSNLSHPFSFNDIKSLESIFELYTNNVAAVILEPMNVAFPEDEFLQKVRALTQKHGSLLIFDETITGFRMSEGGAQEYFGVTPDLTTLGKGIANGYPLSAVVGKKEFMCEMKEIFFSGTFGGELLSLAAANKVLEMHIQKEIVPDLVRIGNKIATQTQSLIERNGLTEVLSLGGHDSWKILVWKSVSNYDTNVLRTLFLQEMIAQGVLIIGSHNVSTSISDRDISRILASYEVVLSMISESIKNNSVLQKLKTEPLKQLFKIR